MEEFAIDGFENTLKQDPLRLLDVGNDIQMGLDKLTGGSEEKRAVKNMEHVLGTPYTAGEIAYNLATNQADNLALLVPGVVLSKGTKAAAKTLDDAADIAKAANANKKIAGKALEKAVETIQDVRPEEVTKFAKNTFENAIESNYKYHPYWLSKLKNNRKFAEKAEQVLAENAGRPNIYRNAVDITTNALLDEIAIAANAGDMNRVAELSDAYRKIIKSIDVKSATKKEVAAAEKALEKKLKYDKAARVMGENISDYTSAENVKNARKLGKVYRTADNDYQLAKSEYLAALRKVDPRKAKRIEKLQAELAEKLPSQAVYKMAMTDPFKEGMHKYAVRNPMYAKAAANVDDAFIDAASKGNILSAAKSMKIPAAVLAADKAADAGYIASRPKYNAGKDLTKAILLGIINADVDDAARYNKDDVYHVYKRVFGEDAFNQAIAEGASGRQLVVELKTALKDVDDSIKDDLLADFRKYREEK